jgi:hypothetical protein
LALSLFFPHPFKPGPRPPRTDLPPPPPPTPAFKGPPRWCRMGCRSTGCTCCAGRSDHVCGHKGNVIVPHKI